jgi:hypothetical protein
MGQSGSGCDQSKYAVRGRLRKKVRAIGFDKWIKRRLECDQSDASGNVWKDVLVKILI